MPGSYRSLTVLLKAPKLEKVKEEEEERVENSPSQMVEDSQDLSGGKWTGEQNLKFAIFVHYYQNIFASKRKRKMCKIFKSLSEYLEKRTPTQCRSHFQKMIGKHKSIPRIKRYYRTMFGQEVYAKEFSEFKGQWEEHHKPMEVVFPELKESKDIAIQTEPPQESPQLCNRCQNREENQIDYTQFFPYQTNPFMFWPNGGQEGQNAEIYRMWMSGINQQGRLL